MTSKLADLARMTVTGTPGTGTITLNAAVSGYLTFAQAGVADGEKVSYGVIDGTNRETDFEGVYTASGTTLTRNVRKSTNSNALVSLTSAAEVFITGLAEDFQDIFKMAVYGVMLPGSAFKHGLATALATGDTDLYTCPTGKRALVFASRLSGLPAAGSVTGFLEIKVSGTYYRISGNTTVTTAQIASMSTGIVLEAGEILAVNAATNTGASAFWDIIEFDATGALFTKKILGPASGDQTVYTVPAGKSAVVLPLPSAGGPVPFAGTQTVNFAADGGGNRVWHANFVPSGGSAATANQCTLAVTTNSNTISGPGVNGTLTAGDFVNLNSTTSLTGLAAVFWVNLIESPNT